MADTKEKGILYKKGGNLYNLVVFCDFEFAGDGCRSRTGYVIKNNNEPIAWYSKRQTIVAL